MQFSGTPTYMAQELFNKRAYDQSVDIFAIGTLLYEIYSSDIPYHGLDPADIKEKLLKDHRLPAKANTKKGVIDISNLLLKQSIDADPQILKNALPLQNWSNSLIGDHSYPA